MSPDGTSVYVTGFGSDALVQFTRNTTTGSLTYAESFFNGHAGVVGLDEPLGLTLSPDSTHIYVAARAQDSIVIFEREPTTGALTYLATVFDGTAGITGLDGPIALTISPSGEDLYAAGQFANTIVHLRRNHQTGGLSYIATYENNKQGITGMTAPLDLTLTTNGKTLAIVAAAGGLNTFTRNPATGALTHQQTIQNGDVGTTGLSSPQDLTITPTNQHTYIAAWASDSIVAIQDTTILFADGFETGDTTAWQEKERLDS